MLLKFQTMATPVWFICDKRQCTASHDVIQSLSGIATCREVCTLRASGTILVTGVLISDGLLAILSSTLPILLASLSPFAVADT